MRQILQDMGSGKTSLVDCPEPLLPNQSVSISTTFSLISAGTERMLVGFAKSNYLNKARKQPEKVKAVLEKINTDGLMPTLEAVKSKLGEPLPLGYSNVGIVTKVAEDVNEFKVGDRVVSNGCHADVVVVKKNLCARIPDNVDDESASFTVVASIGLQGVRLAQPTLGENFVIFGAGLIGLLTIQVLKANGCKVLAIDFDEKKLKLARDFGAETFNPNTDGLLVSEALRFSKSQGIDGVIITASSSSNDIVKQAATISRQRGRIILIGVVGLDLDRSDFYQKELRFQVSCSYGPGRYDENYEKLSQDYPIGFVRWTEQRNFEAILEMMASNTLNVKPLISHKYLFEDAAKAYEKLIVDEFGLGILLDYGTAIKEPKIQTIDLNKDQVFSEKLPIFGFIGAGNYASRILIPAFKKCQAQLNTLVNFSGVNSVVHGTRSGFAKASTDVEGMLEDKTINTVVIATKHDSHADLAIQCLKAGKNVWIEKPIALTFLQLELIEVELKKSINRSLKSGRRQQLMVGFNRRFSSQVQKIKELLTPINAPKSIVITVNSGFIPDDHWTQNLKIGGGRVIGECCHFIDLARFLVGKKISTIDAKGVMLKANSRKTVTDTFTIAISFDDGSVAAIHYFSNGATNFPKERIEVFTEGKILQLDNFRKLKGYGWNDFKKFNLFRQDKGQEACVRAFIHALKSGNPCIPEEEIFEVSNATLKAHEILLNQ